MVVIHVFCLDYVSDRASFTITKIEAYNTRRILSEKFGVLWLYNAAKRDLQLGCTTSGEPQKLVLQCYILSYKINSKHTGTRRSTERKLAGAI
jgi:hypothetical protein